MTHHLYKLLTIGTTETWPYWKNSVWCQQNLHLTRWNPKNKWKSHYTSYKIKYWEMPLLLLEFLNSRYMTLIIVFVICYLFLSLVFCHGFLAMHLLPMYFNELSKKSSTKFFLCVKRDDTMKIEFVLEINQDLLDHGYFNIYYLNAYSIDDGFYCSCVLITCHWDKIYPFEV